MKRILKLSVLSLLILVAFACDEKNDNEFRADTDFGWLIFPDTNSSFAVGAETNSIEVSVEFTAPINSNDVAVNYVVEDVLGNSASVIDFSGSTMIPANSDSAIITITIVDGAAALLADSDIVFDLKLIGANAGLSDGSENITNRVTLACDLTLDIGGTYSVTTTYGFHDFLPDFSTHTQNSDIVDNGDGTFFIQDFSGGLYTVGPYAAAYGTGATSFDVIFSNACTTFVWSEQSDPWGFVIPLEGGVNAIDLDTGVITFSWFCEGYGENGVSVYTPIE